MPRETGMKALQDKAIVDANLLYKEVLVKLEIIFCVRDRGIDEDGERMPRLLGRVESMSFASSPLLPRIRSATTRILRGEMR